MRGRLNAVIDLARKNGVPDEEIAETIVKAVKAEYGNDAARVLTELHRAEVEAGDFSTAVADRIAKSQRQRRAQTLPILAEAEVNKFTGRKSKLNDGLTDSERAYAARLRGGKS